MSFLRFIDIDGESKDVADTHHLYELIKAGRVSYESVVYDDKLERWVQACDHEFFIRLRGLGRRTPLAPNDLASVTTRIIDREPAQVGIDLEKRTDVISRNHRFLVLSIFIYIVAVLICVVALRAGHQSARGSLVILIATPVLVPVGLRALIPLAVLSWRLIGNPLMSATALSEMLRRNSGFVVGGALLAGVLLAIALALSA